jgi:hypothetical protein
MIDPPGASSAQAWSINPAGVITGAYTDASGPHGFIRSPDGTITSFDIAGAVFGVDPFSVNSAGVVTGTDFDANFVAHGFVRFPDGRITTLDSPVAGFGIFARAIDPRGTVAGCYLDTNLVGHGFVRAPNGTLTSFDVPGSASTQYLQGISCLNDYSFLFAPGPVMGMNSIGAVAGSYFQPLSGNPFGGNFRGFLRASNGSVTTFDAVPSPSSPCCTWTFGLAINPSRTVAGYDNDYLSVNHGVLRAANGAVTILDAPGAGSRVGLNQGTVALAINSTGQVAGSYIDATNVYHGFLWIPPSQ